MVNRGNVKPKKLFTPASSDTPLIRDPRCDLNLAGANDKKVRLNYIPEASVNTVEDKVEVYHDEVAGGVGDLKPDDTEVFCKDSEEDRAAVNNTEDTVLMDKNEDVKELSRAMQYVSNRENGTDTNAGITGALYSVYQSVKNNLTY